MSKWIVIAVIIAIVGGIAVLLGGNVIHKNTLPPKVVVVNENGFTPEEVTIKQGQSVTFENKGTGPHWPASNPHPTHDIYPEFDPKDAILPGKSWTFEFNRIGEWHYHDHLIPYNTGTITVTQ